MNKIRTLYYFRRLLLSVLLPPEGQGQAVRGVAAACHFAHRQLGPGWGFARLFALSEETLSELWLSQHDSSICRQTSSRFHLCCLLSKGRDRTRKEMTRGHKDIKSVTSGQKIKLLMQSWNWCKDLYFRHPVAAIAPEVQQGGRRVFLGTKYLHVIWVVTILPIWGNILLTVSVFQC